MAYPSHDFLALVAELNVRRLRMVVGAMFKHYGGPPPIPRPIVNRMILARELHRRFRNGKHEATPREWAEIKDLCNWLVRQHDVCRGKTPRTEEVDMPDSTAFSSISMGNGAYQALCKAVHDGKI